MFSIIIDRRTLDNSKNINRTDGNAKEKYVIRTLKICELK